MNTNNIIDVTNVTEANGTNSKKYVNAKLHILRQMCIRLTEQEEAHMLSLPTTIAVDNYAHKLIMDRL